MGLRQFVVVINIFKHVIEDAADKLDGEADKVSGA